MTLGFGYCPSRFVFEEQIDPFILNPDSNPAQQYL